MRQSNLYEGFYLRISIRDLLEQFTDTCEAAHSTNHSSSNSKSHHEHQLAVVERQVVLEVEVGVPPNIYRLKKSTPAGGITLGIHSRVEVGVPQPLR